MTPKQKEYPVSNLESLANKWGVTDPKNHLKYTQIELIQLLDLKLRTQEGLLEKARRIYKEQVAELRKLKSPELWRFGSFKEAPLDYKEEYFRRMREKQAQNS